MSELNSKARALVEAAQFADDPTQDDYDRVRAAVAARIAVGLAVGAAVTLGTEAVAASSAGAASAGAAAATASGGAAASTATAVAGAGGAAVAGTVAATAGGSIAAPAAALAGGVGTALATKVVAWVAIVGAVAGGATAVARHEQAIVRARVVEPQQPVSAADREVATPGPTASQPKVPALGPQIIETNPASTAVDTAPAPTSTTNPTSAGTGTTPIATPTSATNAPTLAAATPHAGATPKGTPSSGGASVQPAATNAAVPSSVPAVVDSASSQPLPTLDAELALLFEARAALRDGQPDRAMTLLDQHATRFPDGVLAEERAAVRIFALCAQGKTQEARADGARFLADHPRSTHAASVRNSCASQGGNH